MNLLFFENSPRLIFRAQTWLQPEDRWYATMDAGRARALIVQGEIDCIVVRRCHQRALWRAMGSETTEGMPGGRQVIVLPRIASGYYLRRYLRSQLDTAYG